MFDNPCLQSVLETCAGDSYRHRRPPSEGLGKLVGELPQLSLRGFLRGQKIGRERRHFSQGWHEQLQGLWGKVCHFDVWVWGSTERPDLEGLLCHWTWSGGSFFPGMFTLPVWPLEALEASCEGTSLEELRKCSSKGGTELKAGEEVPKKRWLIGN